MTFIGTIGMFLHAHVPVPAHPARNLDLRNAHPPPRSRGEGMMPDTEMVEPSSSVRLFVMPERQPPFTAEREILQAGRAASAALASKSDVAPCDREVRAYEARSHLRHHGGIRFGAGPGRRGPRAPTRPATRRSTPTAPSPSKAWPKKSDSTTTKFHSSSLIGGIIGGLTGYLMQYWMSRRRLPAQHRRQALPLLARLHRHHV